MTTEAAEKLLWERYRRDKDDEAMACLFNLYTPLATSVAKCAFRRVYYSNLEFSDFVQNAAVGLLEAMSRFEVGRGVEFRVYGKPRIRGAVFNGLRTFFSELDSGSERPIHQERVFAEDGDSEGSCFEGVVSNVLNLGVGYLLDSAAASASSDSEHDGMAYACRLQLEERLLESVENLPERLRMIVSAHYFQHVKFQDIASSMGITKGRVSQLNKIAMEKIRTSLRELGVNDYV